MNVYERSLSANLTPNDKQYRAEAGPFFDASSGTTLDRLMDFPKFVPRQALSLFLAKHDLYLRILGVHGSIVEGGVFTGGGLFTWAQLTSIYEPYNHNRRVIGFDSFEGFPRVAPEDTSGGDIGHEFQRVGAYSFENMKELEEGARLADMNRPIGHIPNIELVQGDACETIPEYLRANPHLVVSLLYLDFDLYEPTLVALRELIPRMPRGAVIGFDELNQAQWPGETLAVMEEIGIHKLRLQRHPITPGLSFAVLN